MNEVLAGLDYIGKVCWEKPVDEIPVELYKQIVFVSDKEAQKDRGLDKDWHQK